MKNKGWKITALASFLVFAGLAVRFIINVLQVPSRPDVAIIGGTDAPTAVFVAETALLHDPFFVLLFAALALFVISLIVLLLKRFRKR